MSEVEQFSDPLSILPRALSKQTPFASASSERFETNRRSLPLESSQKASVIFWKKPSFYHIGIFAGMIALALGMVSSQFQSRLLFFLNKTQVSSLLGFGIEQIALSGHRSTSDEDIFEVLRFDRTQTFFGFNSVDAESRLKKLPWVKEVTIKRVWPNQMAIHFTEREPFAIWENAQDTVLIDEEGRTLGSLKKDVDLPLPRFKGDGASRKATEFWTLLNGYPQIRSYFESAEFVDERHWSLRLKNDVLLELPADFEGSALSFITSHANLTDLLEKPGCHLDLRIPHRPILRSDPLTNVNACIVSPPSEKKG